VLSREAYGFILLYRYTRYPDSCLNPSGSNPFASMASRTSAMPSPIGSGLPLTVRSSEIASANVGIERSACLTYCAAASAVSNSSSSNSRMIAGHGNDSKRGLHVPVRPTASRLRRVALIKKFQAKKKRQA